MKVLILAGGLGTRVRPYTFTVPKPLLPLGEKALLEHLLEHLRKWHIEEVILSVGYQAQLVRAYFGNGDKFGVAIRYVDEATPLGTAGCISLALPDLEDQSAFFVMNGDILTTLNFDSMSAFHHSRGALLTLGYVEHREQSAFGVLRIDGDDVVDIIEKPTTVHTVSAGIYCVSREAARLVPMNSPFSMPELIMAVRRAGMRVCAFRISEYWRALETPEHFQAALNDAPASVRLGLGLEDE